jgi:hypothetical protein
MSAAAFAVVGFWVGVLVAGLVTVTLALCAGDLDVQEWRSEDPGRVMSLDEWRRR